VLNHHQHLFTDLESHALRVIRLRRKLEAYGEPEREREERIFGRIPDDPRIDPLAELGGVEFSRLVIERVLREHGDQVKLNRCPRCRRIPRTPQARQCLWCGHDWH
jgi:hypothetical protein